MKQRITKATKQLFGDRWMTGLLVVNLLICLVAVVIMATSIGPKETQIITHFTSYGATNYYRNDWLYLINFIVFEVIVFIVHAVIATKLFTLDRRPLALASLWLSMIILIISLLLAMRIINVAALG